uniref:Uncharacterized protein n=1 Tax=Arion vulgaris TaxID=1028688 RepID=A0A0B6ZP71_9EUPU
MIPLALATKIQLHMQNKNCIKNSPSTKLYSRKQITVFQTRNNITENKSEENITFKATKKKHSKNVIQKTQVVTCHSKNIMLERKKKQHYRKQAKKSIAGNK